MSRIQAWVIHISTALVGGTGIVYGVMRYLLKPVDEFAAVNHPLQPMVQHTHVLVAPLLVLMLGHAWYHHAWVYWTRKLTEGRSTGFIMFLATMPMIFSGSLIQVSVSQSWRMVWVVVHVAASLLWVATYAMHGWIHVKVKLHR